MRIRRSSLLGASMALAVLVLVVTAARPLSAQEEGDHGHGDTVSAEIDAAHEGVAEDLAEHGDEHGGEHAAGGPLDWKSDLAVWTFVVFCVLLAVLWKFAWGPISAGLDKRERGIADNIEAAQHSNDEAKRLLSEYERKLAAAQDEVRAILDEARRDAEHTTRDMIGKAQAEATAHRDRALKDIERAKDGAITELAEKSAELAVDLAGRIVNRQLSADDHAQLIEQSLAKIGSGNN